MLLDGSVYWRIGIRAGCPLKIEDGYYRGKFDSKQKARRKAGLFACC